MGVSGQFLILWLPEVLPCSQLTPKFDSLSQCPLCDIFPLPASIPLQHCLGVRHLHDLVIVAAPEHVEECRSF